MDFHSLYRAIVDQQYFITEWKKWKTM